MHNVAIYLYIITNKTHIRKATRKHTLRTGALNVGMTIN